ncbi:MAG: HAMP domain-containing histidine kinase [Carboxylicivirga sp.]|jgi:signal transduction histidine kinase|nr:HAMP domain-containing histidine kinase [Carboxylicivirga sp.]
MNNAVDTKKLKADFNDYLRVILMKNLTPIVSVGILVLCYYLYSDWFVRKCTLAAAWRLAPIIMLTVILSVHLVSKDKYYSLKKNLYVINYLVLQLMMFCICLIHLKGEALAPSVTGVILIIFLISLDNKQNRPTTLMIYFLPISIFSIFLFTIGKPSSKEFFVIFDVYPIIFIGYLVNRVQYKLRFKLFRSNYLLKLEQDKTQALYSETLSINSELKNQTHEAIVIKEEIQQKNEALKKSNATKDRFLGIIAHDLKNPISTIWGLSDLLMLGDELDKADRNQCIRGINDCVKHTHDLLENLLEWACAQTKSMSFQPEWLNAFSSVERELKVLQQTADKKRICIQNNIDSKLKVFGDQKMFDTIIRNLVSNAIKYTYAGGTIKIDARIKLQDDQSVTQIIVSDDGVGMSKEVVEDLFKITRNKSTKGTDNEEGTGLGLLLIKEFVDKHQGNISVESTLDKGSSFIIELPVK